MSRIRPICISIAGLDPSGGAGILADIKTFEQLKTLGLAVQTANTLQVEDEFKEVIWTPQEVILAQLELLLQRYTPAAIKIGLIENSAVLQEVLKCIKKYHPKVPIVWDPVLQASFDSGLSMDELRFTATLQSIVDEVNVVTPNAPEYLKLNLKDASTKKVYLKGGHTEIDLGPDFKQRAGRDFLISAKGVKALNAKGKDFLPKHGTGCILSSALAAYIARGFDFHKASIRAKSYVYKRASSNPSLLAYHNNG
ncbi:hydroxymethylpyrimidine/phosphomethylpyrimidine kinase [Lishizhenia tianjinensis]|uniref:hydroxymethylpyrimidine kinase n=1 Tax=Lishizhenia tianjinensis TaxID=477690 RepID=A0A1I7B085_9FLAO|nr:hydroxymethylpyrimidine/phosphomethylpyrimidine kinase [Lishizhenia tianjinensis]SFT80542.1 hydroxymethylpyrimidine/phosphomethylpyrimidine kinase [Lishizhenia tianjinensis]